MNRNLLFALGGGLLAGGLIGYFLGKASVTGEGMVVAAAAPPAATAQPMAAPAPMGAMPGTMAAPPSTALQQTIANLERLVLQEPSNRDAWVQLGNGYYDTQQPQKAVTAYGKALSLKGDDPDVLTDQGVMYRQLGQFEKAIANFQKANKVAPKHLQSLYNMGIVYANDLHKPAEATAAWDKIIALAPASQQAEQARQGLASLKGPGAK